MDKKVKAKGTMPQKKVKTKNTLYYRNRQAIRFDFSAEEISSDGGVVLLDKLERTHGLLSDFSKRLPDYRDPLRITHSMDKLIKQRVFLQCLGYEDCNDSDELSHDPILKEFLEDRLASQPTLSRLENTSDKHAIKDLLEYWVDRYVASIDPTRKDIVIDVDSTDDQTHGHQQLSRFHGYYYHHMYHILLFHDGETGQVILPFLRAGNTHTASGATSLLKRIVQKIRKRFPTMKITLRADSGFSGPGSYHLAQKMDFEFCIGIPANERLKRLTAEIEAQVKEQYVSKNIKYQEIVGPFLYQAKSWDIPQQIWAKVESTGRGLNVRYIASNIDQEGEDIYFGFYVHRGEASENRIKELKNMCYADRLSCHSFHANFLRLLFSCLSYELMRLLKDVIAKTNHQQAKKWQVHNIRLFLLKIGACVKTRVRTITVCFSRAFPRQALFRQVAALC
ncbi:MAG: IS1380 family transposase [Flavobacteriales bacterium]|nr:IS1380 family transposase [Flavobacteriales bacterium]